MNPKFKKSIEIAYALWNPEREGRCFHISFCYERSKLIKMATNQYRKTHPITARFDYRNSSNQKFVPGIHSELALWIKLGLPESMEDYTIVNIRIDKTGKLSMSKPCVGCSDLLSQVGFKNFYFTNQKGEFEEFA